MPRSLWKNLKRYEIYVMSAVVAVVFVAAMALVAWMVRSSIVAPPYQELTSADLKEVFATAYLRYREDDGTPYLKVEIHNGSLWWIKKLEFDFDGLPYSLSHSDAFRPMRFGAMRAALSKPPTYRRIREIDLRIRRAFGYPPASVTWGRSAERLAEGGPAESPR